MKFIAVPILMLLIMSQTFSNWFMIMSFKLNQEYIAKNLCENRYRPQLNCKGNCVLMKKLRQQEKEEQNSPAALKLDISTVVISSRSFFATIDKPAIVVSRAYILLYNIGRPVSRSSSVFHPPSLG
jgi:hypothetical protein